MGEPVAVSPRKVAFLSTVAPGDTPRLETMLGYALVARSLDYETKIFFALDSGLVMKRAVFEKLGTKVRDQLRQCVEMGVQMEVCQASARTFNIRPEELIPGVQLGGIANFLLFAEQADVNFSWS
jgi:predicted peroxiredoxin